MLMQLAKGKEIPFERYKNVFTNSLTTILRPRGSIMRHRSATELIKKCPLGAGIISRPPDTIESNALKTPITTEHK